MVIILYYIGVGSMRCVSCIAQQWYERVVMVLSWLLALGSPPLDQAGCVDPTSSTYSSLYYIAYLPCIVRVSCLATSSS